MAYTVRADLDGDAAGAFETDWSAYLMAMTIRRGRQSSLQEQQPSTLELTLNNADGRFSPDKGTYSGLDHFKRVQVKEGARYRFTGYIIGFGFDPHSLRQQAIITCTDMLGMAQNILVSVGNIIDHTADLVLNRILDLMQADDIITNPGAEADLTNWASVNGATVSRETTEVFEGEGAVKVITPGSVNHEGVSYDVWADGWQGTSPYIGGAFVKAPDGATMRMLVWNDYAGGTYQLLGNTDFTGTGAWQHVRPDFLIPWNVPVAAQQIRIETRTSAQAITFYVDSLQCSPFRNRVDRSLDTGLTTLNRVSFGEERADVALRKVVDSEPGLFWFDGQGRFIFKNRDRQFGNATANFGYETQGTAGNFALAANNKLVCKQTLSHDGYVESVTIYCKANSGTANVRAVIYDDDSGPDALVALADEVEIDTTLEWKTFTFPFPVKLAAGDYWLGLHVDARVDIFYDAGDVGQDLGGADTYSDGTENPFGGTVASNDREFSIYSTYRHASPELTWSDDGVDKKYQGLDVNQDARARIRFVRIRSQGDYTVSTVATKVWEYEQVPFAVLFGWPDRVNYPRSHFQIVVPLASPMEGATLSVTPAAAPPANYARLNLYGDKFIITLFNKTVTPYWWVTALSITAKTYTESLEEGIYEYEAEQADPWVYRSLNIEMPFLGKGEGENVILGEATRLGGKHVNRLVRANVIVKPDTAAYLTDIFGLELRDCVNLENKTGARSLNIDENCWIEGYQERVTITSTVLGQEFTFYVEEV